MIPDMGYYERIQQAWTTACMRELGERRDMQFLRLSRDGESVEMGLTAPDKEWIAPSGATTHHMVITVDLGDLVYEHQN